MIKSLSILFIDDQMHLMEDYIESLEWDGHIVKRCSYVEDLPKNISGEFDLAILDIQIIQKSIKENINKEFDTSTAGLKYVLPELKRQNVKVIIFTNINEIGDKTLRNEIQGIYWCHKASTGPSELSKIVAEVAGV